MFKKLFDRIMDAKTPREVELALIDENGVDMMYQREKISWEDHERLFTLGARMMKLGELIEKAN